MEENFKSYNCHKFENETFRKWIFIGYLYLMGLFNKNHDIENNTQEIKHEIICIYNKHKEEINLLHDYNEHINNLDDNYKKAYIEGKKNIKKILKYI